MTFIFSPEVPVGATPPHGYPPELSLRKEAWAIAMLFVATCTCSAMRGVAGAYKEFSYITELGYCCWTKKEVQLDMRYYYPNTHYKLAKVKVYVDDLVLLDNNDEASNGRYGEIRCSYFEIIEIFDAIELLSPRECTTPENTD